MKLSGSHTSATVGEVVKQKKNKKREIQEVCFVKDVVSINNEVTWMDYELFRPSFLQTIYRNGHSANTEQVNLSLGPGS